MKKLIPLIFISNFSYANTISNSEIIRDSQEGKPFASQSEIIFSGNSGSIKSESLKATLAFLWDDDQSHFMIYAHHDWSAYENEVNRNRSLLELRMAKAFSSEQKHMAELTLKGQKDKFLGIESQSSASLGYRLSLKNPSNKRLNSFGVGMSYEIEEYSDYSNGKDQGWRVYGYWHHRQPLGKNIYIQNAITLSAPTQEFDDARISNELRLVNEISQNLSMGLNLSTWNRTNNEKLKTNKETSYGTFISYSF